MSIEESLAKKDVEIALLKHENAQLKKLIFGAKSERFKSEEIPAEQGNLFEDYSEETKQATQTTEKITYTRKKNENHKGRKALPEHLPVREEIIEPEEDTTDLVKIGEVVTETLEYTPASLVKLRRIRPKYVRKDKDSNEDEKSVVIASMPERPLPKCIAEPSLLAYLIVSKFIDHLPFYRQIQMFKRDFGWEPSKSTVNDWFIAICTLLEPLYERLKLKLLNSEYIHGDESPIKVQDSEKKKKTHQGYQWVYHSPEQGIVLFHYHRSRSVQAPKELLSDYKGWLQCDGYPVYDKLAGKQKDIKLVGCWVHARRKYHEAQDSDKKRAKYALTIFKKIYEHEAHCKDFTVKQRKTYRLENVQPLLQELRAWIEEEGIKVLPKSPMGKAMAYTLSQWDKLICVLEDGRLSMDNNVIENKIRPLALGRKNYLFAGSHKAAQRIAMMYTFFATCKINEVNPRDWLNNTINNIQDTSIQNLDHLLPIKK